MLADDSKQQLQRASQQSCLRSQSVGFEQTVVILRGVQLTVNAKVGETGIVVVKTTTTTENSSMS